MAMQVALALALLAGAGLAAAQAPPSRVQALIDAAGDAPPPRLMAPWIDRDAREQARSRVLNEMEAGTLALLSGRLKSAEALFGDAQQLIETIYANNPAATAARGKFVAEASKEFKGDPYERAMVGYYLGLTDLAKGEYDNARASFRFAILQDTMSADETYQDDMALAQYLVGWTYWCEGNRSGAAEEFDRARRIRPELQAPLPGHRLLLLAETGKAPRKLRDGQYGELLRFGPPPPTPETQVAFSHGGQQHAAQLAEDLFFQASTRGGAAVDAIRAGKASFRQGAEGVASAGGTLGAAALGAALLTDGKGSRQLATLGVVAGVAGLVAGGVARNTETEADDRAWMSLPNRIYLATAAPADVVEAGFFDAGGRLLYAQAVPVRGAALACSVGFTRAAGARPGHAGKTSWQAMPALAGAPASSVALDISDEGASILERARTIHNTNTPLSPAPQ